MMGAKDFKYTMMIEHSHLSIRLDYLLEIAEGIEFRKIKVLF